MNLDSLLRDTEFITTTREGPYHRILNIGLCVVASRTLFIDYSSLPMLFLLRLFLQAIGLQHLSFHHDSAHKHFLKEI